jgi:Ca2+-binding EF-hand superfamily protein
MGRTWKLSAGIALVAVAALVVVADPAFGQRGGRRRQGPSADDQGGQGGPMGGFRGRGGPQGGFRGQGGPGGGFRGRGGPQSDGSGPGGPFPGGGRGGRGGFRGPFGGPDAGARLEQFLQRLDTNGDGRIDENEVEGRRRNFVEMMARQAGVELRFPIAVNRLRDALNNASGRGAQGSSSGNSQGAGEKKPEAEPLVPGFGVELALAPVLKFGERAVAGATRAAAATRSSSGPRPRTPSSSSSSGSRGGRGDDRVRGFAEAMMRRSDRNGNGKLEPDEWNERLGDFTEADRNHDGAVTSDELAQRLSGFAQRRPGGNQGGPGGSSGGVQSGSGSANADPPKSYRLRTPTELLPKGLPPWFAQKDRNADGQVAMAEYESPGFWTETAVAEFKRYDLNNDGMITPEECLKALNQAGQATQVAKADVPAQAPPAAGPSPRPAQGPGGPSPGQFSRGARGSGRFNGQDRRPSRGSGRGSPAPPSRDGGSADPWAGFD